MLAGQRSKSQWLLVLHLSRVLLLSDFSGKGGFVSGKSWSGFVLSVDGSPVELVTWQVTAWTDRTEVCKLDTFYELFCFASLAEVF